MFFKLLGFNTHSLKNLNHHMTVFYFRNVAQDNILFCKQNRRNARKRRIFIPAGMNGTLDRNTAFYMILIHLFPLYM